VRELACLLPIDAADVDGIGNACALCTFPGRSGVGCGGDEQTRCRVAVPHEGQGIDEGFPTLIPIEVARVEANTGVSGQPQCAPRFIAHGVRCGLFGPRDRQVVCVGSEEPSQ